MKTRTALITLMAYMLVVTIGALTIGPEPHVLHIPLNTFLLSLGLFLTPVLAWFLVLKVHTSEIKVQR